MERKRRSRKWGREGDKAKVQEQKMVGAGGGEVSRAAREKKEGKVEDGGNKCVWVNGREGIKERGDAVKTAVKEKK